MNEESDSSPWSLPYESRLSEAPATRRWERILRIVGYVVLTAAIVASVVQFQAQTRRNLRRAAEFDREHPNWTRADRLAGGPKRPKPHKGAIGRWRKVVPLFWGGENIYLRGDEPSAATDSSSEPVYMHPNMPFVVILLTPFAWMSAEGAAICWNLLKIAVLAATVLMAARLAGHGRKRIPDWTLALGIAWTIALILDDILHGNTNTFVLGAVVFHLWLYRRGRDVLAGIPLALAICLKMTPAIFVLYWLYQRNWKLLAGALVGLAVFVVVIPAVALGPSHYAELTGTWVENLIMPGLVAGAWYPTHVNQSISGVFGRYFLAGANGDIFWGPDDNPYSAQQTHGWITLVALSPAAAKMLVRLAQVLVLALVGWGIGWRKLARDDGRRMLHYGLVVMAMLLLNQRTWEHHATVLLIANVAIWQAIAYGRFSRAVRAWTLGLMLAAGGVLLCTKSSLVEGLGELFGKSSDQAEMLANYVKAYGSTFWYFVLLLVVGVMLAVVLRNSDQPYASQRQKLGR